MRSYEGMIRAKNINTLIVKIGFVVATLLFVATLPPSAQASHDFTQDHLIDDELFIDYDSLTVAQIQSFLDSNGSLLANWTDDIDMRRPSDNCIVHHATGMTAAEVIYEAATTWGAQVYDSNGCAVENAYWSDAAYSNYSLETVSPKALLVMLQKEQSLVSANGSYSGDPNDYKDPSCCSSNEYKLARAMGYGVPDSGGINEKFLGFYNQVNWAAWQLRYNFERAGGNTDWDEVSYLTYTGPMTEGTFRRCGTCAPEAFDGYYPIDGSPIYISNRATASLYFYTPHTYPGFFGNFNFVNFYEDWFGSVFAQTYDFSIFSTSGSIEVKQGFSKDSWAKLKNTGGASWYDEVSKSSGPAGTKPVRLATDAGLNRSSVFSLNWPRDDRTSYTFSAVYEGDGSTLSTDQNIVLPGQVALFRVDTTPPNNQLAKTYTEKYTLVQDGGVGRFDNATVTLPVKVTEADYTASFISKTNSVNITDDSSANVYVKYRNDGNVDWFDQTATFNKLAPLRLATTKPINRYSGFRDMFAESTRPAIEFDTVLESDNSTVAPDSHRVKPGQYVIIRFAFNPVSTPPDNTYTEWLQLIRAGASSPLLGSQIPISVNYSSTKTFGGEIRSTSGSQTINSSQSKEVYVAAYNRGSETWYDTQSVPTNGTSIRVGSANPTDRLSSFRLLFDEPTGPALELSAVYEADGTTLSANQHEVLPGQIATYKFNLRTPTGFTAGTYSEDFHLIDNDGSAIPGTAFRYLVTVN